MSHQTNPGNKRKSAIVTLEGRPPPAQNSDQVGTFQSLEWQVYFVLQTEEIESAEQVQKDSLNAARATRASHESPD
jgi:hypothetical protein